MISYCTVISTISKTFFVKVTISQYLGSRILYIEERLVLIVDFNCYTFSCINWSSKRLWGNCHFNGVPQIRRQICMSFANTIITLISLLAGKRKYAMQILHQYYGVIFAIFILFLYCFYIVIILYCSELMLETRRPWALVLPWAGLPNA